MTSELGFDVHGPDDAPALVLGSSLGTTRTMWDDHLARFAQHFRVVRYDHRGHGESKVPEGPYTMAELAQDVVALMDHLGIARARHGGVSLGGMVAMQVAIDHPERVDSLGLVCTSAHLPPASAWRDRAETVRRNGMKSVVDTVTVRWFTPAFAGSGRADGLRRAFVEVPPEGYASCCEAIAAMDLRAGLGAVRAPALVIAGSDDHATPVEHARTITAAVNAGGGAAELVVVPGAHLAAVEHAGVVGDALLPHWGAHPQAQEVTHG